MKRYDKKNLYTMLILIYVGRTTIAVSDEIAARLLRESKKRKITEYALANKLLENELNLMDKNMESQDIEASIMLAQFVKDMGSLPLPAEVIGEITEQVYRVDKEWLGNIWFNLGKKLGTYMHAYVSDIREIENHSKQIIRFVPIKLVKVESKTENSLTITIIGSWTSSSLSYCIGQTLNGIMETYSYKMKNLRFGNGFLVALFEIDLKA